MKFSLKLNYFRAPQVISFPRDQTPFQNLEIVIYKPGLLSIYLRETSRPLTENPRMMPFNGLTKRGASAN